MVYYGLVIGLSRPVLRNMNTARVIIAAIVALIAASIIIGVILLLGGLFPKKQTTEEPLSNLPVVSISVSPVPSIGFQNSTTTITPVPSTTVTPTLSPTQSNTTGSTNTNSSNQTSNTNGIIKTYNGEGFSVRYPDNWGLLTCSNSKNFELDPTSPQDVIGVVCDYAVKPVTFVVRSSAISCPGNKVTLGSKQVTKSIKTYSDGDVYYRWCFMSGGKQLDVTHRVSQTGTRATSTTDYSAEVETIISDYETSVPS